MRRDNVWAKLSGPYLVSKQPSPAAEVTRFARKMVEIAPDRLVWGTDWPHPTAKQVPDDATWPTCSSGGE